MPLYEYECKDNGHIFEVYQKAGEEPIKTCKYCSGEAVRIISRPTLLQNRGIYIFDRRTKDDILHPRPSSIKSLKKDKF